MQLLNQEQLRKNKSEENPMSKKEPIYILNNVSKIFQDKNSRTVAVDDVSFEINKGEIFGIIGMSGAGKSTLVRTLNRLEEVSEGQVIFDGKELGKLNNKELRSTRKEIAMIFQGFNLLLQKNVLANVVLPLKLAGVPKKEREEKGLEMLKVVGLEEKAKVYPAGETAANRLGFSTQVPMNACFITSGTPRTLKLGNRTVTLKHGVPKNFAYKGKLMPELVQALRNIGEKNITEAVEKRVAQLLSETPETATIEHDLLLTPVWVRKIIKRNIKTDSSNE